MNEKRGTFIFLDGPEGSGKSTVIDYWKDHLQSQGKKIFDLKAYWKQYDKQPPEEEVLSADIIFSAECTYTGIGKVIREELIRTGTDYPSLAIGEAYALDRLVLYKKYFVKALAQGTSVITDRAVSTSLAYQTTADPSLTYKQIAELPGNAFALEHPPQHFILFKIDPALGLKRLATRYDKKDDAIFEQLDFQKKIYEKFMSAEYQKIFTDRGTQFHYLSADQELAILKAESLQLLHTLLSF
jgi:dTMP kinase